MTRFIFKRIAAMVFVLFSISVLVFLIFFATPGVDPAARIAGRNADQLTLQQVRVSFELDKPIPLRYLSMMRHLFISQGLTSYVNRGAKVLPQLFKAKVFPDAIFFVRFVFMSTSKMLALAGLLWE